MANIEMFKRIRDQIKRDPKSFDMSSWEFDLTSEISEEGGDFAIEYYDPETNDYQPTMASECGTTRCVAGWAVYFAAEDLGIDVNRPLEAVRLDYAQKVGLRGDWSYSNLGLFALDIDDSSLFYEDDVAAYRIVDEFAEGLRD